jgi:hypothetical protein
MVNVYHSLVGGAKVVRFVPAGPVGGDEEVGQREEQGAHAHEQHPPAEPPGFGGAATPAQVSHWRQARERCHVVSITYNKIFKNILGTVNSTSDYTLCTLYRCYIKGIRTLGNIEL